MTPKTKGRIVPQKPNDDAWMNAAAAQAARGLGTTWPNPTVGCVIVKNGRVLGRGRTAAGGRPHAEPSALKNLRASASGADVYVTLEPCSHHGATPPCTDALVNSKVSRVIIGNTDPDPRVNGRGIQVLLEAGIDVSLFKGSPQVSEANIGFFSRIQRGRPTVTLKLASTLDGKIAMSTGESKWITGSVSRRTTHVLRSKYDAILVGRATVEADDPMLDVREMGAVPSPVRVVVDTKAATNIASQIVSTARRIPTWILAGTSASDFDVHRLTGLGAKVIRCEEHKGRVHLVSALQNLGAEGITRVLCEGGSRMAASLLAADLVDDLVLFQAGKIIGKDGLSGIGQLHMERLADVPEFELISTDTSGHDIMSTWRRMS